MAIRLARTSATKVVLTCVLASALLAQHTAAQDTTHLRAGQRVRLKHVPFAPSERVTGILIPIGPDSLGITDSNGRILRLSAGSPLELSVFDGRRSSKSRFALIGAAVGAAILAVTETVSPTDCSIKNIEGSSCAAGLEAVARGAVVGAIVGAVIGWPKRDRWREIQRPWKVTGS